MGSCKYYTEVTLGWMLNNKIIVVLSLLSFCLFVSTLAMAGQKRGLSRELEECRNSLSTTVTTPTEATTEASTTTVHDGAVEDSGAETPVTQSKLFQLLAGAS